jgi:hypothetical protein
MIFPSHHNRKVAITDGRSMMTQSGETGNKLPYNIPSQSCLPYYTFSLLSKATTTPTTTRSLSLYYRAGGGCTGFGSGPGQHTWTRMGGSRSMEQNDGGGWASTTHKLPPPAPPPPQLLMERENSSLNAPLYVQVSWDLPLMTDHRYQFRQQRS